MKTVFMFAGQGSQYFQMGAELFQDDATFRAWMQRLDAAVVDSSGRSVIAALYETGRSKSEQFDQLSLTHPAIFMVEVSLAHALIARGIVPQATLGVSLGAFAAAVIAGSLDAESALRAVVAHASILEKTCPRGGMIAVLAEPDLHQTSISLREHSELVAINFENHFVVSALEPACDTIETILRSRGVAYQRLPVRYAFHSRWIDLAKVPCEGFLNTLPLSHGRIPMFCSVRAAPLPVVSGDYFWTVAREPMYFAKTIAAIERTGPCQYVDVGPGGTLATFLRYVLKPDSRSRAHATLSPFGNEQRNFSQLDLAMTRPPTSDVSVQLHAR